MRTSNLRNTCPVAAMVVPVPPVVPMTALMSIQSPRPRKGCPGSEKDPKGNEWEPIASMIGAYQAARVVPWIQGFGNRGTAGMVFDAES